MKVLIAGDICPVGSNAVLASPEGLAGLSSFDAVRKLTSNADYSVANLECVLSNEKLTSEKVGPRLLAEASTAKGIRALGFDLMSLANNHVGDFGPAGIRACREACAQAGLETVGIQDKIGDDGCVNVVRRGEVTVAIVSFSDHEFGMVSDTSSGAAPFDLIATHDLLGRLSREGIPSIVLLHDGKEYYALPSPELQRNCRFLIDCGASLVVCQHNHTMSAHERYLEGHIVYGQGNLLFDYAGRRSPTWTSGFAILAEVDSGKVADIQLMPYRQAFPGIRFLSEAETAEFAASQERMAREVVDPSIIAGQWLSHCEGLVDTYFNLCRGPSGWLGRLDRKLGVSRFLAGRSETALLQNVVRSRSHREALLACIQIRKRAKDWQ